MMKLIIRGLRKEGNEMKFALIVVFVVSNSWQVFIQQGLGGGRNEAVS